jgi:hypothetical protein
MMMGGEGGVVRVGRVGGIRGGWEWEGAYGKDWKGLGWEFAYRWTCEAWIWVQHGCFIWWESRVGCDWT